MKINRVLILSSLVLWTSAHGQEVKKQKLSVKRVEVASDAGMKVHTKDHWATFSNNVDIKLDDFRLRCDQLRLTYSEKKDGKSVDIETLEARGHVVCNDKVRQIDAKSDRLDYEKTKGLLVFSSDDRTEVKKEGSHMSAKSIKVNLESGEVLVDGSGRLEIDLQGL